MKPRIASATLLLLTLAALAAGSGCGHDRVTQPPAPQEEHGIEPGGPPPPIPVVGLDTARAGGSATLTWLVWNESPMPFTMQWTLESQDAWPGLPQNGSLDLASLEGCLLATTVNVPDTAA